MEQKDIEREAYRAAKERVENRIGFLVHLTVYLLSSVVFVIVWFTASGGPGQYFWPAWPIAAWGIGVLFHAILVFGDKGFMRNYREKKMRQFMDEEMKRMQSEPPQAK